MIGLDTNILVADAIPDHLAHTTVRRELDALLSQGHEFALTSAVLSEFIHIATDSRRFRFPLSIPEALAQATFWSDAEEAFLIATDLPAHRQWLRWLDEHGLGRKRLLDTLLAATWHAAGIREILTLNPRDFEIFGVFTVHAIDLEG